MISLPNCKMIKVIQRDKEAGDITSAIEWLLKYHQIDKEVNAPMDWDKDFQEKILQRLGKTTQNFTTAISALTILFPCFNGELIHQSFIDSQSRCLKIKKLLDANQGCVISLALPSLEKDSKGKLEAIKKMLKKGQLEETTRDISNANLTIQIMPVVGYTNTTIIMLDLKRKLKDQKIEKKWIDLEQQQKFSARGNDLCFLEKAITKYQSTLNKKRKECF